MDSISMAARRCLAACMIMQLAACQRVLGLEPINPPNAHQCECTCRSDPRSLESGPIQSADDAEEVLSNNTVLLTGRVLDMGVAAGPQPQQVGIRFSNLGIPKGATITSASVQFTASATDSGSTFLSISGQASDDGPAFAAAISNISSRARTSAFQSWTVPPWNAVGEAGLNEQTPDLSAIFQELVNRDHWAAGNAAVIILAGTGLRRAVSFDANPSQAPKLSITYQEPDLTFPPLTVCNPDDINPDLHGHEPSDDELVADCQTRVATTLHGLTQTCGYPSTCQCDYKTNSQKYGSNCSAECTEVPLDTSSGSKCSNFDPPFGVIATNAPGDAPVCTASSPLTAHLFGQRSTCSVSGTAAIQIEGEDDKTPHAAGVLEFTASSCPGQACAVNMDYVLDVDPVTYDSLFSSATFQDLHAIGESLQSVPLVDTAVTFPQGTLGVTAAGRRDGDRRGVIGTNDSNVATTLSLASAAPSCSLNGKLVNAVNPEIRRCQPGSPVGEIDCTSDADCGGDSPDCLGTCRCLAVAQEDMTMTLDVSGPVINRPPTANAGGTTRNVDCNETGGARFFLDGLGSSDPDENLASFAWFRGSRVGPAIGYQPRIEIEQALGTNGTASTQAYVFRVIDRYGQADEDTTRITVRDQTPPVVSCNIPPSSFSPPAVTPSSQPVSYIASATDYDPTGTSICDPQVTASITGFRCFRVTNNAQVDTTSGCKPNVGIDGSSITIRASIGVGNHIVWTVSATDDSGNTATRDCEIQVVSSL